MLVTLPFCIAQGNFGICLFSEQSTPCSGTLWKWSPYFYKEGVSGTDLPLSFTFTCSASFRTPFETRVKALWFVGRYVWCLPSQSRKGTGVLLREGTSLRSTTASPLLSPRALGKPAWWVGGSTSRGSASAVWCSINACNVVAYWRREFQELERPLSSDQNTGALSLLLPLPTSADPEPLLRFIFLIPQASGNFSYPGLLPLWATRTPVAPSDKSCLPSWGNTAAGCTAHSHTHRGCGKARRNLLLHRTLSRQNFGRSLRQPLANA